MIKVKRTQIWHCLCAVAVPQYRWENRRGQMVMAVGEVRVNYSLFQKNCNMALSDILYTNRRKLQKAKAQFLRFSLISCYKRGQGRSKCAIHIYQNATVKLLFILNIGWGDSLSVRGTCVFWSSEPTYKTKHRHTCIPVIIVLGSGDRRIALSYWPVGLIIKWQAPSLIKIPISIKNSKQGYLMSSTDLHANKSTYMNTT